MTHDAAHPPPRTLVCGNYRHDHTCPNDRLYTVEAEIRPDGLWRYPTGLCCPHCGTEVWNMTQSDLLDELMADSAPYYASEAFQPIVLETRWKV